MDEGRDMSEMHHEVDPVRAAGEVVGRAIENLAAARLARAFIPLAAVCLAGVAQALSGFRVAEGMAMTISSILCCSASCLIWETLPITDTP